MAGTSSDHGLITFGDCNGCSQERFASSECAGSAALWQAEYWCNRESGMSGPHLSHFPLWAGKAVERRDRESSAGLQPASAAVRAKAPNYFAWRLAVTVRNDGETPSILGSFPNLD